MAERLRDTIAGIEHRLDKGDLDFLNRRLILRQALEAVAGEARKDGYNEGMHDALDAQHAAEREASDGPR